MTGREERSLGSRKNRGIKIFLYRLLNRGNGVIRKWPFHFCIDEKGDLLRGRGRKKRGKNDNSAESRKKGPRPVSGRVYVTHVNASCRKIIVHVDAGTHVRRKFFTSVQHSP